LVEPVSVVGPSALECALQSVLSDGLVTRYSVCVDDEHLSDLLGFFIARKRDGLSSLVVATTASPGERIYAGLLVVIHILLGHTSSSFATLVLPQSTVANPFGLLAGRDLERHGAVLAVFQAFLRDHERYRCGWPEREPLEIQVERYLLLRIGQFMPLEGQANVYCSGEIPHDVVQEFAFMWHDLVARTGVRLAQACAHPTEVLTTARLGGWP
jgi:hypothetical protein